MIFIFKAKIIRKSNEKDIEFYAVVLRNIRIYSNIEVNAKE